MNLFQRLLIFLFTLLVILCTFFLTIYSFGILSEGYLEEIVSRSYGRYEVGILSLVVLLLAIYLLQPLTSSPRKREALIQETELGSLMVSLDAIGNLIEKEVLGREGIEQVKTRLNWLEDGLEIRLRLKVLPQLELPGLTSGLQSSLREHIEKLTGVKVYAIKILVEEITSQSSKTSGQVG